MHRTVRFVSGSLALLAIAIGSDQPAGGSPRPRAIELSPLGVYQTGLFDEGAVEIAAYDPASRRAYLTFAERPKDHSQAGFGLDGGRDDGANRIAPWPVRGMYQPDGIANFRHKT